MDFKNFNCITKSRYNIVILLNCSFIIIIILIYYLTENIFGGSKNVKFPRLCL